MRRDQTAAVALTDGIVTGAGRQDHCLLRQHLCAAQLCCSAEEALHLWRHQPCRTHAGPARLQAQPTGALSLCSLTLTHCCVAHDSQAQVFCLLFWLGCWLLHFYRMPAMCNPVCSVCLVQPRGICHSLCRDQSHAEKTDLQTQPCRASPPAAWCACVSDNLHS